MKTEAFGIGRRGHGVDRNGMDGDYSKRNPTPMLESSTPPNLARPSYQTGLFQHSRSAAQTQAAI